MKNWQILERKLLPNLNPEEAKRRLQVLCANCNWIKRHENREFGGDDS